MSEVAKSDVVMTKGASAGTPMAELDEVHDSPGHAVHEASVVPDPAWGWVGESPKLFRIAGVVVAVMLLLMIIGNHTGRTEDIFLVGFAVFILLIIFKDWALNKMALRK